MMYLRAFCWSTMHCFANFFLLYFFWSLIYFSFAFLFFRAWGYMKTDKASNTNLSNILQAKYQVLRRLGLVWPIVGVLGVVEVIEVGGVVRITM